MKLNPKQLGTLTNILTAIRYCEKNTKCKDCPYGIPFDTDDKTKKECSAEKITGLKPYDIGAFAIEKALNENK